MKVAIIMGSITDYKVMKEAEDALRQLKIPFKTEIISAHRTPEKMVDFAKTAHEKKFSVIIAAAGGAAHLPGMVASLTPLPVIGVPIVVGKLKGIDALMSIQQMPKGIPVATVAIENAFNAGLLAARMIGAFQPRILRKIQKLQKDYKKKVREMNQTLKAR